MGSPRSAASWSAARTSDGTKPGTAAGSSRPPERWRSPPSAGGITVESGDVTLTGTTELAYNESEHGAGGFTIVDGTLTGGYARYNLGEWGGGGRVEDGIVDGLVAEHNEGAGAGLAIYGTSEVRACVLSANIGSLGGGIFVGDDARATIVDCEIVENEANSGGAISASGRVDIVGTTMADNPADAAGGFVDGSAHDLVVEDNVGAALCEGGGLFLAEDAELTGAVVTGNTASIGGGIRMVYGAKVSSTVISGNAASSTGGGISAASDAVFSGKDIELEDVTVTDDTAASSAAMYVGTDTYRGRRQPADRPVLRPRRPLRVR